MVVKESVPTLIQLMYGEQAGKAAQGASERLLRWCTAFEAWLESHPVHNKARLTLPWRELLSSSQKMPWQITERDVRAYLSELKERGYANGTIHMRQRYLEAFYAWSDQQVVDWRGYNPVKNVPRPKVRRYGKVQPLSSAETRRLLAVLQRDDTPLGKRDYAFFLARLMLGVRLKTLLELRWGQIEVEENQAWVTWQEGESKRARLPEEVWKAIRTYVESSGRSESMRPDDYIFAPLAKPLHWEGRGVAEEWNPGTALNRETMMQHLKRFGRLAGIPEEKLTLSMLRHTAARLRMEAGGNTEQIHEFLDRGSKEDTISYLNLLAALPEPSEGATSEAGGTRTGSEGGATKGENQPPHRMRWGKLKHGLYARQQSAEELAAILAENIEGLDEEVEGLQRLNQALFEMFDLAESHQELARLVEVSGRSEARLAELVRANKDVVESERKGDGEAELRARLEKLANDLGGSLEEWGAPGTGETRQGERDQSIARLRLGLRRILAMMEGEQEINARVRYTDLYGKTCVKLAKLLRPQAMGEGSLFTWWREAVDEAREGVVEKLGISI